MNLLILISFLIPLSGSVYVDPYCEYYQKIVNGITYYIYNKEFPGFYSGKKDCRWTVESSIGTTININGSLILPSSSNCIQDKFILSLYGDRNLTNEHVHQYCGVGSFNMSSIGNKLVVGHFSKPSSNGGRFLCDVRSQENFCSCGMKMEPRIVGGEETGINEFPFMAAIVSLDEIELYCGGAIIAENYILTTANCLYNKDLALLVVLVGEHDFRRGNEAPTVMHKISGFIIHPQFNSTTHVNDIAVIRTLEKISFSIYVSPVCLPFNFQDTPLTGKEVTLLGWGQTTFGGSNSDVLKKVDVKVVDTEKCASVLPNHIDGTHLCTYANGKDSCLGDSGGPVILQDPSTRRLVLVGIISYGFACATNLPSVNTRVSSYLSWIGEVTPDASYCK